MKIDRGQFTTCSGCGFQRKDCICGKRRNTSGSVVAYSNYNDLRGAADYSTTRRTLRETERTYFQELLPVNDEELITYFERTSQQAQKLIEHSIFHHLYGTKQTWSCHTSTRYCFICTLCQQVETLRQITKAIPEPLIKNMRFRIDYETDPPQISFYTNS